MIFMSLVSLTFGAGKQSFSVPTMMHVFYPKDSIQVKPGVANKLQILKVSTFYNSPEVYIVGQVISGVLKDKMVFDFNGRKVFVSEIDSKLKGVAKEGMTIGFSLLGISPGEFTKGSVLEFSFEQESPQSLEN